MKFSFFIINFNRLHYLRSCVKSLEISTADYSNKEFICIDDNSKEEGTEDYLNTLRDRGWKVINQQEERVKRSQAKLNSERSNVMHMYAFSDALQIGLENSSGDIIVPLHGDSQFIRTHWLQEYRELFEARIDVGSALFDAQRKFRLKNEVPYLFRETENFFSNSKKHGGIVGSGDCAYRKSVIEELGGFEGCSEDEFVSKFVNKYGDYHFKCYTPRIPTSVIINTDKRGTNARVRGNKRYGEYWRAQEDLYYKFVEVDSLNFPFDANRPMSIEEIAIANGDWELPIDNNGNWKKNPIDIENSQEFDIIY